MALSKDPVHGRVWGDQIGDPFRDPETELRALRERSAQDINAVHAKLEATVRMHAAEKAAYESLLTDALKRAILAERELSQRPVVVVSGDGGSGGMLQRGAGGSANASSP